MAFAETQKLTVQLDLGGNFQAKIGAAARALQGFDRSTSRTQQSLSKFGRNIERGIVVGASAAAAGFVAVAKAAGDFESQMNTIATIVDRKDIPKIGDALRKTARETGLSLDDLSAAYYDLASAGVKGELATEALNDAVKLGIGGLATTAETVDLLTTAINAYHLDAAGAAKATDQFALAVADGKVKASEIAATFADVASLAKTYSIGIDQIAASYAVLTAQGVPASEVTTEMQRAIISLISPTKDLEEAQKKLKISFTEEIRKKGLVPALQELRVYSDKTGIPLIDLLGRIEAVKYTLQTTGSNFAPFNAELAKMGNASGTAAQQMAERQQGLNFQLNRLKALAKDAGITIGSALLPKLTPLVEKLNNFISNNQGKIAQFGTQLASGFEKLAAAVGKVDWQPFIDGLRLSGDIAKTVIGAFRSLPADLQKLVIAGFALNKVTGGLGTSIVKDLGGAIIGTLAKQRGSSPLNPLFVSQVGGVPGVPAAAGLGLGAVAGAATIGVVLAGGAGLSLKEILNASNKNNELAAKGLTQDEITAYKFYNLSKADQETAFKRLMGHIPSLADLESANKKLAGQIAGAVTTGQPPIGAPLAPGKRLPGDGSDARGMGGILAHTVTAASREAAAKIKDDIRGLGALLSKARSSEFQKLRETLAHPKSPAELRKAADGITKLITQGRGSAQSTERVLKSLRSQLKNTHDPKLAAALRADIRKVEARLPGRQFAAAELANAKKILASGHTANEKIAGLQGIEKALKDRSLPHAASVIRQKIAELQRADVAAQHHTAAEIRRKRLAVTVNNAITVPVSVTGRSVATTIRKSSRFGVQVD